MERSLGLGAHVSPFVPTSQALQQTKSTEVAQVQELELAWQLSWAGLAWLLFEMLP